MEKVGQLILQDMSRGLQLLVEEDALGEGDRVLSYC
jgi:hypothetical protein